MIKFIKKYFVFIILTIFTFYGFFALYDIHKKAMIVYKDKLEKAKIKKEKFDNCKKIFKLNKYDEALTCFNKLSKEYSDCELRHYIGWIYLKKRKYKQALLAYQYISDNEKENQQLLNTANKEVKLLKAKIAELKRLKRHDIGNYFSDIDRYAQWENPENIIVYIDNKYQKKELLKKAFMEWDNQMYNMINFSYTDNEEEADITASAEDLGELRKAAIESKAESAEVAVGLTTSKTYFYYKNPEKEYIKHSRIMVAYNDENNKPIEDREFYSIALHEIGHSIGMMSHSKHYGDLMYAGTSSIAQQFAHLTNRDVNTIRKIYGNI